MTGDFFGDCDQRHTKIREDQGNLIPRSKVLVSLSRSSQDPSCDTLNRQKSLSFSVTLLKRVPSRVE